jgi:polar amino acid transport system substrate-binding protein
MKSRRLLALGIACLSLVALVACGNSSAAGGGGGGGALLSKVKNGGTITVGTSSDAPLSYVDSSSGQLVGVLPDMINEFLQREGASGKVKLTPATMPFDSLIPSLQSGRIDLVGDAMYATDKRKKVIDFTDITFFNPEGLVVPKGNPNNLHTLSDLCGRTAGSYEGTTYIDLIKETSAKCGKPITLKSYPKIEDVMADISAGRLDAGVIDASLSAYAVKQNPNLRMELVSDYQPPSKASDGCAFGVTKDNAGFVTEWNSVYAKMKADGTVAKILEKWGLTPADYFLTTS